MTGGGYGTAVLTPCQNSHEFRERRVSLSDESVKVGRSVARLKPQDDNAIFDCKVLSRNHAVLWYEDGFFYLKDTKSSNGTFVNNDRLSKGAEESEPRKIFSGDILQFGVDIVENAKKLTHGCIIAILGLYHPNGQEAVNENQAARESSSITVDGGAERLGSWTSGVGSGGGGGGAPPLLNGHLITPSELFQLHQYIKEASHREAALEAKLETLQGLVASTQEASESNWKALMDEDRLLSRIEMLEAQLAAYSKAATEETLRDEVLALHSEKAAYENGAKESLRRALEEKVEAVNRMADVERSLETTEEEASRLREACANAKAELESVRDANASALERQSELERELAEAKAAAESASVLARLEEELAGTRAQLRLHTERAVEVEARLASSDRSLHAVLESALARLRAQLAASSAEAEKSEALTAHLNNFANELEAQLREALHSAPNGAIITPPLMNGHGSEEAPETVAVAALKEELGALERERKASLGQAQAYQRAAEAARLEAAELQASLSQRTEELEAERRLRSSSASFASASSESSPAEREEREALHRQAAKNSAEWAALREECSRLRERMASAEEAGRKETSRLRKENRELTEALGKAQAELEHRSGASPSSHSLDSSSMDASLSEELLEARRETSAVRERAVAAEAEAESLRLCLNESGAEAPTQPSPLGLPSWRSLLAILLALILYYVPFSALFPSSPQDDPDPPPSQD